MCRHPGLPITVTPASLPVTMSVYQKTATGSYVPITGSVPAGTTVQIRLSYIRNNPYTGTLKRNRDRSRKTCNVSTFLC